MEFPPFPPFPLICPRASKKGENEKNVRIMLKWWKKGENEKNVNIMLKWWNKQIKFQNNAKMVKKGGKTK